MDRLTLQFHAAANRPLMVVLVGAIAAVLVGGGVLRLVRRRWREAAFYLSAAAGPVALAVCLAVDAARQYAAGRKDAARLSVWAAVPVVLLAVAAGLLVAASVEAVWLAVVAAWAATAMGVFYASSFGHLGAGRLAALMALRLAAVVVLLGVLFKPAVSVMVDPETLKPVLAVLIDRSGSMATADEQASPTRLAQVLAALAANRQRMESVFRPRWRLFGKTVEQVKSFEAAASASPSGEGSDGTDIALAIRQVSAEPAKPKIPAILLLSDGIHNGPATRRRGGRAGRRARLCRRRRLDPAAGGRARNIRLISLDAPLDVARDSLATVRATFQVEGLASVPLEVRLSEEGADRPLATAKLAADKSSAVVTAELSWTAKGGTAEQRQMPIQKLIVSALPHPAEAVSEDNTGLLHVLMTDPRIGVLYIEGSIRPEFKFLKRLLDSDPQLQLASLVRVSGNRFSAAGALGGRAIQKLPAGPEDFRSLDVMILGDLDRSFLTDAQMSVIRQFVNSSGGLLMLGGHNSFGPGGYGGTDIEAVLPVTVGGRDQPQETSEFLPYLTAAGVSHPATVGMERFFPSPNQSSPQIALPPLAGCVTVVAAKPAATVLAVHPTQRNAAGPLVILAVQQVGAGRAAAFTADTTWRWDLPMRATGADSPYHRFWGQLIRYLARAEVKTHRAKPSVLLRLQRTCLQPGETAKVSLRATGEGGSKIDPSHLRCTLSPLGGSAVQTLTLLPRPQPAPGLLETVFSAPPPGRYTLRAAAFDEAGKEIASDELPVVVAGSSVETDRLARDQELLRRLAERSGGQVVELTELGRLVGQIVERHRNPAQDNPTVQTYRVYHFPLMFGAFVALVTVEWVLRRRWQLQ